MTNVGRTPKINPRAGRDHFPQAFSAVLAGGETVSDRPVAVDDMFQSFYKALRIDANREHLSYTGRPIKFVDGGEAVKELFS